MEILQWTEEMQKQQTSVLPSSARIVSEDPVSLLNAGGPPPTIPFATRGTCAQEKIKEARVRGGDGP